MLHGVRLMPYGWAVAAHQAHEARAGLPWSDLPYSCSTHLPISFEPSKIRTSSEAYRIQHV
jgi:hypothetical protein